MSVDILLSMRDDNMIVICMYMGYGKHFFLLYNMQEYTIMLDAKLNVFCHTILSKAMVSCIIFSSTEQIVCTEAIINFNVLNSQCKCMIYTLSSRVKFPAVQ